MLPFQLRCTYILLPSICVNVFSFHVACDHCSPICSSTTPAIQLQNLARTYMKTPFLYSILAIRKTERLWTIFFLDLIIPANTPTTKWIIRNLKMFYIGVRNIGLQCNDGKWNSWILLNQLLNHNFWQILVIMYIGPQHKKGLSFKL